MKEFCHRFALHNKLKNGGFTVVPFVFVPYQYNKTKTTYLAPDRLTWFKQRITTGVTLSDVADVRTVPGWTVQCSKKEGATIEYDPVDMNKTGFRLWSRDGGSVLAVKFNSDCIVTLSQTVDYFNEFYLQDYTVGLGGYTMTGSPFIRAAVDNGVVQEGLFSALGENFGEYRRVCKTDVFPGDSVSMKLIITIEGKSGESVGLSGVVLCLGSYSIECPFVDNPVYYELPSGTVLLTESANDLEGYESLDEECFLYQTYGDALSLDNFPPDGIENPDLQYAPQMYLGNDNHNAHFSQDPYALGDSEWLSDVAWGALRVKSPDFNDRGVKNPNPTSGGTDYYFRVPDLYWLVKKWTNMNFAGWGKFDLATLDLEGGDVLPADTDIKINEFARTARMAVFLPASPGLYKADPSDVNSKYMDYIEQEHRHLFKKDKNEKILPVYKVFKACRKI